LQHKALSSNPSNKNIGPGPMKEDRKAGKKGRKRRKGRGEGVGEEKRA
jgi:hypothetical protein